MSERPPEWSEETPPGEGPPVDGPGAGPEEAAGEETYALSTELIYAVEDALEAGETAKVSELLQPFYPSDLAVLL